MSAHAIARARAVPLERRRAVRRQWENRARYPEYDRRCRATEPNDTIAPNEPRYEDHPSTRRLGNRRSFLKPSFL
jgi:hypothetical protein